MLQKIAASIWHKTHDFSVSGIPASSRMTVVRLGNGKLWLHSPVPLADSERIELPTYGAVGHIVAPNSYHHLFLAAAASAYPDATVHVARGLADKHPGLASKAALESSAAQPWSDDISHVCVEGAPKLSETVFFHKLSRSLIVTDLCQWWQGKLPLRSRAMAHAAGVRKELAVPATVGWQVKDRHKFSQSLRNILEWPFERVIMAHNSIVEDNARSRVEQAFARFL